MARDALSVVREFAEEGRAEDIMATILAMERDLEFMTPPTAVQPEARTAVRIEANSTHEVGSAALTKLNPETSHNNKNKNKNSKSTAEGTLSNLRCRL